VVGVIAAPNLPPPLGLVVETFSGNFRATGIPRRPDHFLITAIN
jgi:hypothetical protein